VPLQQSLTIREKSQKSLSTHGPWAPSRETSTRGHAGSPLLAAPPPSVVDPPPRRAGHPSAPERWRSRSGHGIHDSGEPSPRRGRGADPTEGPHLSPPSGPGPGRTAVRISPPVTPLPREGDGRGGGEGPKYDFGKSSQGRGRAASCAERPITSPQAATGPALGAVSVPMPFALRPARGRPGGRMKGPSRPQGAADRRTGPRARDRPRERDAAHLGGRFGTGRS